MIQVGAMLARSSGDAPDARTQRVLVLDDEPDICSSVRNLLERSLKNVVVVTAPNGFEGLEMLKSQRFDLIVTDFKMPGMNGLEFIQEAMKLSPRTPRILITAFERELIEEGKVQQSFDQVFTKPLEPRPLVRACQRMLGGAS